MSKQNKLLLFFFVFSFALFYSSWVFALEINPENYPHIPFTDPITAESQLPHYIVYFFALGIYLAGALAVISLAIGGIQLIFSGVSPEARNNAIDRIKSAVLGLVLVAASVIIIRSINPALEKVQNTVALMPVGGLQLQGSGDKMKPAPKFLSSLDGIRGDYSAIVWPTELTTTDPITNKPITISNCDPDNPNAVYVIYWYDEKNFEKMSGATRLKCDGQPADFIGTSGSYEIVKEEPGIYFYDAPDCHPALGSDSLSIPRYSTKSIPEWNGNRIKSIRIVNGPDPKKGPFFGAVFFNDIDYRTRGGIVYNPVVDYIYHKTDLLPAKNYSECHSGDSIFFTSAGNNITGSIAIYQWAGFKDNNEPNINCAVDLYSRSKWTGGKYEISNQIEILPPDGIWQKKLDTVRVTYPSGTNIPIDEQRNCQTFVAGYECLQSFEIKGNCLVVVSSGLRAGSFAQAFPISPRLIQAYQNRPEGYSIERGTPGLASDYITSLDARYMIVIPLAKKITE